jgi:hypothetical protein
MEIHVESGRTGAIKVENEDASIIVQRNIVIGI